MSESFRESEERYLTVEQLAAQLQVHESTVRWWVRSGKLHAVRLGARGNYRIPESALRQFLTADMEPIAVDRRVDGVQLVTGDRDTGGLPPGPGDGVYVWDQERNA